MVREEFFNFFEWIGPAVGWFFVIGCVCIVLGTIYGFAVSAVRNGPGEAFYSVATVIAQAGPDLLKTSPRRVFALSKLAVQESFRRRIILVTFAIFAISLLVGGWFLDSRSDRPNEIYLSVVLFGTQLLILLTALMISCFSLPQDIRQRTIYTVVTKPVRTFEIILGRIFGFGAMGTVLLASMGIISYLFVTSGLRHSHTIDLSSFEQVDQSTGITPSGLRASPTAVYSGHTQLNSHHRHPVEILSLGEFEGKHEYEIMVMPTAGHRHDRQQRDNVVESVYIEGDLPEGLSEDGIIRVDSPDDLDDMIELFGDEREVRDRRLRMTTHKPAGYLQSRVPKYADDLRFLNRQGEIEVKGVSIGDEWEYRSYIDGGPSQARAIYSFSDFREDLFIPGDDPIQLELTLGVFRTHKGNIERGVTGQITLVSEVGDITYTSQPFNFESKEFQVDVRDIPRTITARWTDENGEELSKEMHLFDEFAPDGNVEVWLRCSEGGQFFGVAQADVYFRQQENRFEVNFLKGYICIWLQMMIVTSLGVMFSTFVSGPVSMLGCFATLIVMSKRAFIHGVESRDIEGGGPLESMWRLITQNNLTNELEAGTTITVVQSIDWVLMKMLSILATSVPDLAKIDTMEYLARGYDISFHTVGVNTAITFGFCLIVALIGYFRLKTREIAA